MLRPNGLKKITIYVRPDQYLWLRALSLQMAVDNGGGRPDASALLQGMLDLYRDSIEKPKKKKKARAK
jgi:hypothetical protein